MYWPLLHSSTWIFPFKNIDMYNQYCVSLHHVIMYDVDTLCFPAKWGGDRSSEGLH